MDVGYVVYEMSYRILVTNTHYRRHCTWMTLDARCCLVSLQAMCYQETSCSKPPTQKKSSTLASKASYLKYKRQQSAEPLLKGEGLSTDTEAEATETAKVTLE